MKRILAVDDEEGIRRAIVFALRKIATVTTASNGAEAMALMKGGERFDCVVLDLDMPKASRAEVVSWMKSVDERRDVPIVMLTAYESSDLERDLAAKGAAAYLTKPVDLPKLIELISALT